MAYVRTQQSIDIKASLNVLISALVGAEKLSGTVALYAAAALTVAETVILGMGVFYRYVLGSPLMWSDELALILFAWLGMFGSVVALRHHRHMRLTAVISKLSVKWQKRLEAFSRSCTVAILATLLIVSVNYTADALPQMTPAMEISEAYRSVAFNVGFAMMLLTALTQLVEACSIKSFFTSAILLGAVTAGIWAAVPFFNDIGNYNLVFFFVIFVMALIVTGIDIALVFAIAAIIYIYFIVVSPPAVVINRLDASLGDIDLLSIPMFIFLGVLMELTGIARALVNLLVAVVGNKRGGMQYVMLCAMYLVSGISGSKSADMAAIAPILFPEMKRRGDDEGEMVSLLSSSAAMAETIPPSLIMIAVGVTASVSISSLFVAGLLPAGVGLLMLGLVVYLRNRKAAKPEDAPTSLKVIGKLFIIAIPALILPLIIRFAVVKGIASATEVATIGVIYSIACGLFIYRQFPLKRLMSAFTVTASLTGAIMLVTGLAGGMAWSITQSGFASSLADALQTLPGGSISYLLISMILFAVIGSILEGYPAIAMFAPLTFPTAIQLGINPVHYAMVVVLSMSMGLFAPPFGVGFYSACAITGVAPDKAMSKIWIYMGAFAVSVLVIAFVPWLSTAFLKN